MAEWVNTYTRCSLPSIFVAVMPCNNPYQQQYVRYWLSLAPIHILPILQKVLNILIDIALYIHCQAVMIAKELSVATKLLAQIIVAIREAWCGCCDKLLQLFRYASSQGKSAHKTGLYNSKKQSGVKVVELTSVLGGEIQNCMRPIFAFSILFGPPAPEVFWSNTNPSMSSVSSTVPLYVMGNTQWCMCTINGNYTTTRNHWARRHSNIIFSCSTMQLWFPRSRSQLQK